MAKFKPGESGNKGGRPKGAKGKAPEQIRAALLKFIDDNLQSVTADFKNLEPKDRLKFFNDILRHVIPPPFNPSQLTEDQMKQVIEYLQNEQKNNS
jgi:hypothetical protein